jgi:hypothetical protein
MWNTMKQLIAVAVLVLTGFSGAWAKGAQVTLAWDAPATNLDGSAYFDVGGFKVYFGTTSHVYNVALDVGNVTTTTVSSLPTGRTYYFAATTYNTSSNESAYCDELVWTVPPVPGMTTVRTVAYTISTARATIVFGLPQATENGTALTNAAALITMAVNQSGTVTQQTVTAISASPPTTASVVMTLAANTGYWTVCGAVSNKVGQVAPWGVSAMIGTSAPGKTTGLRVTQFQY